MANIAYVRATSADQNADRQTEALQKYHIDKWFSDKVYEKIRRIENSYGICWSG